MWTSDPFVKGYMRADAKKNYDHLIAVARDVVTEQGADASMREIARRAEVGMATLLRHFPTREALFEALLQMKVEELIRQAAALESSSLPDVALMTWFREGVAFTQSYSGICTWLASAHADPDSALHASSTKLRTAGERLLARAQAEGTARRDVDGVDLFALMSGLAWLLGQNAFASREDHFFRLIGDALLIQLPSNDATQTT